MDERRADLKKLYPALDLSSISTDPAAATSALSLSLCLYLHHGQSMVEGVPYTDPCMRDGLPTVTGQGRPVHYYAGNDDAALEGSVRNPLRWQFFLHALYLQGGVAAVRARVAAVAAAAGCSVDDPAFPTRLRTANRAALFAAVAVGPDGRLSALHPGIVPTEAGSAVLFLLHAPVIRAHATAHARLMGQSPPVKDRQKPGATPHFLPAFLELLPRFAAHPELMQLGRENKGGMHGMPTRVPHWRFRQKEGAWEFSED
jgi:hypothetical protein